MPLGGSGQQFWLHLLPAKRQSETQKDLVLYKHCSAVPKTLICDQHSSVTNPEHGTISAAVTFQPGPVQKFKIFFSLLLFCISINDLVMINFKILFQGRSPLTSC